MKQLFNAGYVPRFVDDGFYFRGGHDDVVNIRGGVARSTACGARGSIRGGPVLRGAIGGSGGGAVIGLQFIIIFYTGDSSRIHFELVSAMKNATLVEKEQTLAQSPNC